MLAGGADTPGEVLPVAIAPDCARLLNQLLHRYGAEWMKTPAPLLRLGNRTQPLELLLELPGQRDEPAVVQPDEAPLGGVEAFDQVLHVNDEILVGLYLAADLKPVARPAQPD
jgi:hypothetical protein